MTAKATHKGYKTSQMVHLTNGCKLKHKDKDVPYILLTQYDLYCCVSQASYVAKSWVLHEPASWVHGFQTFKNCICLSEPLIMTAKATRKGYETSQMVHLANGCEVTNKDKDVP